MISKKQLLISTLIITFGLNSTISEAATKKNEAQTKSKINTEKQEKKNKKQVIVPTESFYNKIWEKFKVGDKKDREEVIKTLHKITKDTPDEFMAYYYLGIALNEEGYSDQALKNFEVALAGFPKSSDIHIRMAKILDEKFKTKEANEHYILALSLDNNNPKALSRVGIIELEKKNYAKASEYLKKAKDLEPDNSATLKALGESYSAQGNYTGAIEILEQVLLFDNTDANAHLLLGKAYEKNGNPEKAAEHIEFAGKYGKRDSNIVQAIGYDIGRNLALSGKYEEAISAYKKEIKKNKQPAIGYFEMAKIYENIEDNKNAIKSYQKAYELDKKMIQGVFRCAEIYKENNDKENAEKMLKILKNNAEYKEKAQEMLDDLKVDQKEIARQELEEKLNNRYSKDSELEEAYLENYNANKKDPSAIEKLYNFYKDRGYYEEALKWYRKYAKVSGITDYEKKNVEQDLKEKLEQDNYSLYGGKSKEKPGNSKSSSDELLNIAFNGDNDKQKEMAFQILLSRKEYKEDRKVLEGATKFYEERGKVKEANKYINKMKKLGYLSDAEAKSRKNSLK